MGFLPVVIMKLRDLIDFKKGTYKWEEILKVPEFAKLKETEQNPKWHAEGSVWAHTVNVCNEALKICDELNWISGGDKKKTSSSWGSAFP